MHAVLVNNQSLYFLRNFTFIISGYVDTDMSNHQGHLTIEQGMKILILFCCCYLFFSIGAETPVYLALLPENVNEPKGKFVKQKKIVNWAES